MSAGLKAWGANEAPDQFPAALEALVRFCVTEVLPHLEHDEDWLREAEKLSEKRLLAKAMRAEARAMESSVEQLLTATGPCEAMALTRVLHSFLAAHDHHEKLLTGEALPAERTTHANPDQSKRSPLAD